MRIKYKGEYIGNYSGVPRIGEARVIKRELNMLPFEFETALDNMDPDATAMLVAIMFARRSGDPIEHQKIDGEYTDVEIEYTEGELADMTPEQRKLVETVRKNADKLRAIEAAGQVADDKGKGSEPPSAASA